MNVPTAFGVWGLVTHIKVPEISPLIPHIQSGHLMETKAGMLEVIRDCDSGSAGSHTFGQSLCFGR